MIESRALAPPGDAIDGAHLISAGRIGTSPCAPRWSSKTVANRTRCNHGCIAFCPLQRAGTEVIWIDEETGKDAIGEETCVSCEICVGVMPTPWAVVPRDDGPNTPLTIDRWGSPVSLHIGACMFEGDHRARLTELFAAFRYRDTHRDRQEEGPDAMARTLAEPMMVSRWVVRKAVCYLKGWTVVVDEEMVMDSDEAACSQVSSRFGCRIFGWLAEGASDSYGFNLYEHGRLVRGYLWVDGDVTEGGTPLDLERRWREEPRYSGERGQVSEEEIEVLIEAVTGVTLDAILSATPVIVKELDESNWGGEDQGYPPAPTPPLPERKSRWKIWK